MFTKKQLEEFKTLLTEKIDTLLNDANKTVSTMTGPSENYPDPTDRASLESERNFKLRLRDRERKLIGKIKNAIERIENGTFGVCDECGEDISEARLKARPVTTLCIDCKQSQEKDERLKGI